MNHTIDRAEKVNSRAALIACGLEDPTTALGRVARSSLFDRRLVGEIWSFAEPKRIRVGNDPFLSITTDGEYIYAIIGRELHKRICKISLSSGQTVKEITHVGFRPLHLATALVWQDGKLYLMTYSDYCVSILNTALELMGSVFIGHDLHSEDVEDTGDVAVYDNKLYVINCVSAVSCCDMNNSCLPQPIHWKFGIQRIVSDGKFIWISRDHALLKYNGQTLTNIKLNKLKKLGPIYTIADADSRLIIEFMSHGIFACIDKDTYKFRGSIKFMLDTKEERLWGTRKFHEMCAHGDVVCIASADKTSVYVFMRPFSR